MLATVKGYYDGTQIVMDEEERKHFTIGDEVIITILDRTSVQKGGTREERRKRIISSGAYVTSAGRTTEEMDNYLKEMRENDRF